MSLRSQSRKLTVIIQNDVINKSNCHVVLSGKCFALCTNEMINAHSKPDKIHNNTGEYETFSFWILNFVQCAAFDQVILFPS